MHRQSLTVVSMSMAQFAPRRIVDTTFPPYPEGSYCLRVNGQMTDVIANGYAPTSPPYTTAVVRQVHVLTYS